MRRSGARAMAGQRRRAAKAPPTAHRPASSAMATISEAGSSFAALATWLSPLDAGVTVPPPATIDSLLCLACWVSVLSAETSAAERPVAPDLVVAAGSVLGGPPPLPVPPGPEPVPPLPDPPLLPASRRAAAIPASQSVYSLMSVGRLLLASFRSSGL